MHLRSRTTSSDTKTLLLSQLPKRPIGLDASQTPASPIISINGRIIDLPYAMTGVESTRTEPYPHIVLKANVPVALAADGGIVSVSWPFLPTNQWTATYRMYNPASVFAATRLSEKSVVISDLNAAGFTFNPVSEKREGCWTLVAEDVPVKLRTSVCPEGRAGPVPASDNMVSITLANTVPDKVVLVAPYGTAFTVDVPKLDASKSNSNTPISLKQFDALWVDVPAKDLEQAATAQANGSTIKVRIPDPPKGSKPGAPPKTIQLYVTRDITATPGAVDATVFDASGKQLGVVHLQILCVSKCTSGGK